MTLNPKRQVLCIALTLLPFITVAQGIDTTHVRHLDEVVVTGWAGSVTSRMSPVPVSTISSRALAYVNATNIIDAISHQPGLAQITTGSGISKPVIRGLGYNRIVVVNDGIRQEGQQWGDEHGIEIDPQSIHSVEIIKGPASLLYGSDAMSGVIIFKSSPVLMPETVLTSISNEYQTNNGLIANSVFNAGHVGSVVWDARISQKDAHAYRNRSDGYVFNSGFSERAASGMVGANKDWGYSHVRLGYYYLSPGIVEGERNEDGSLVTDGVHVGATYGRALPFQKVQHGKIVSDNSINLGGGSLKATLGYQWNDRREFEEAADECGLHFSLHTLNYDLHYLSAVMNGWRILSGVNGMYQKSLNLGDEFLVPEYSLLDAGAFLTAQKSFDRWSLSGGLRYDLRYIHSFPLEDDGELRFMEFRKTYPGLSASLGVSWNPIEQIQVKANLSKGFRSPNISELASNGVHEGTERYEIGSSELKSENSFQADLGIDYYGRRISFSVSLFANRIDSFIFTQRSKDQAVIDDHDVFLFTQNDALLYGGEVEFDWNIVRGLSFSNSFSYVSGRFIGVQDEDSRWLPLIPAPRLNSELRYDFSLHSGVVDRPFVKVGVENYFSQNRVHAAFGTETKTTGYLLLNAAVGTDIHFACRRYLTILLTGENLTNAVYQSHLSRLKYTDINPLTGAQGVYNMGINVGLKLIWNI